MSAVPPPIPPPPTGASAVATGGSAAAAGGSAAASDGSIAALITPGVGVVRMTTKRDGLGSEVEVISELAAPKRRKPGPSPNRPIPFYGRAAVLSKLGGAIADMRPFVVAGGAGAGKSTALSEVANSPAAMAVADGIVIVNGSAGQTQYSPDEIAQRIYKAIWDTTPEDRHVTVEIARAELNGIHPLVIVDGAALDGDELRIVADIVPRSPVLFASEQLPLGGPVPYVPVPALSRAESVSLLTDLTGWDPNAGSGPMEELAALLDDWPGALTSVGGLIGAARITVDRALALMRAAEPGDRISPKRGYFRALAVLEEALTEDEMSVLEVVAALAGASVRDDIATQAAGLPGTAAADSLVASTIARHNSPRLRVDEGLLDAIRDDPERMRAANAPTLIAAHPDWLLSEDGRLDPDDLPVALAALDAASRHEDHTAVRWLARAVDPVVTLLGNWDAWARVLTQARRSADAASNPADAAWADHQMGTRALAAGDFEQAGELLVDALKTRRELGLTEAAARSEHNLKVLHALLMPPPPTSPLREWIRRVGMRGPLLAIVAVVGLLVLGPRIVDGIRSVLTPVATPTQSAGAPSAATSAAPSASAPTPSTQTLAPPLGATMELLESSVDGFGAWRGLVAVTPQNGLPPYTFKVGGQDTAADGVAQFPVQGVGCEFAVLAGTLTSSDLSLVPHDFRDTFRPPECDAFNRPQEPQPKDPPPDEIRYLNCSTVETKFAWGTAGDTAAGWTWLHELQRRSGDDWSPVESSARLRKPTHGVDVPCRNDFRWRVAAVSSDLWQSDWSDWSPFGIWPTEIPKPSSIPRPCGENATLSWDVSSLNGIARYGFEVLDAKSQRPVYSHETTEQFEEVFLACGADYQWRVWSIDAQSQAGDPSDWSYFTVPAATNPPIG